MTSALVLSPAGTIRDFVARPFHRYYAGDGYVFWHAEQVNGITIWGRPTPSAIEEVAALLDVDAQPGLPRHASFIDLRDLREIDFVSFQSFVRAVVSRQAHFARVLTGQAIVRPDGFVGTVVAGFYRVFQPQYPVEVFVRPREGLTWLASLAPLGVDPDAMLAALEAVVARADDTGPLELRRLRRLLETELDCLSLADVSARLGVSARTLQRQLAEVGSSFRDERAAAQVRAASRMLRDSEEPITRIAVEVGCASPSHFSDLFRRMTGETPSDYRARTRTLAEKLKGR